MSSHKEKQSEIQVPDAEHPGKYMVADASVNLDPVLSSPAHRGSQAGQNKLISPPRPPGSRLSPSFGMAKPGPAHIHFGAATSCYPIILGMKRNSCWWQLGAIPPE